MTTLFGRTNVITSVHEEHGWSELQASDTSILHYAFTGAPGSLLSGRSSTNLSCRLQTQGFWTMSRLYSIHSSTTH